MVENILQTNKSLEALKMKFSMPSVPLSDRKMIELLKERVIRPELGLCTSKPFMKFFKEIENKEFSYFGKTEDDFFPEKRSIEMPLEMKNDICCY